MAFMAMHNKHLDSVVQMEEVISAPKPVSVTSAVVGDAGIAARLELSKVSCRGLSEELDLYSTN